MQKTFPTNKMPPRSMEFRAFYMRLVSCFGTFSAFLRPKRVFPDTLSTPTRAPVWSTRRANQLRNLKVRCFNVVRYSEYGYTTSDNIELVPVVRTISSRERISPYSSSFLARFSRVRYRPTLKKRRVQSDPRWIQDGFHAAGHGSCTRGTCTRVTVNHTC